MINIKNFILVLQILAVLCIKNKMNAFCYFNSSKQLESLHRFGFI